MKNKEQRSICQHLDRHWGESAAMHNPAHCPTTASCLHRAALSDHPIGGSAPLMTMYGAASLPGHRTEVAGGTPHAATLAGPTAGEAEGQAGKEDVSDGYPTSGTVPHTFSSAVARTP